MGWRIAVAGVGAMGGTIGAYLSRAGADVVLVDPWAENVERMRRSGLTVKGPDGEFRVDVEAIHLDQLRDLERPLDVVFLSVKSYDTEWMTRALAPYLAVDGCVVSAQNGINEDVIASVVGAERTVGCVVHMSGGMYEPAVVTRYSSPDWLTYTVGELDGKPSDRVERLAGLLAAAGRSRTTPHIRGELWAKLTLNCATNALGAMSGLPSPRVWLDPDGFEVVLQVLAENARVCRAMGHRMEPVEPSGASWPIPAELLLRIGSDPRARSEIRTVFEEVAAARSGARAGKASMLQDVEKGRRTEIDYLNGYVVREGALRGIPAPANAAVVMTLKEMLAGEITQEPTNLARVAGQLAAGG